MNLLFIGMTAGVVGKAMLAYGVVLVHIKMAKERRIDEVVIHSFQTELIITLLGIALIVTGYFFEVISLGGTSFITMACEADDCAAAILNAID